MKLSPLSPLCAPFPRGLARWLTQLAAAATSATVAAAATATAAASATFWFGVSRVPCVGGDLPRRPASKVTTLIRLDATASTCSFKIFARVEPGVVLTPARSVSVNRVRYNRRLRCLINRINNHGLRSQISNSDDIRTLSDTAVQQNSIRPFMRPFTHLPNVYTKETAFSWKSLLQRQRHEPGNAKRGRCRSCVSSCASWRRRVGPALAADRGAFAVGCGGLEMGGLALRAAVAATVCVHVAFGYMTTTPAKAVSGELCKAAMSAQVQRCGAGMKWYGTGQVRGEGGEITTVGAGPIACTSKATCWGHGARTQDWWFLKVGRDAGAQRQAPNGIASEPLWGWTDAADNPANASGSTAARETARTVASRAATSFTTRTGYCADNQNCVANATGVTCTATPAADFACGSGFHLKLDAKSGFVMHGGTQADCCEANTDGLCTNNHDVATGARTTAADVTCGAGYTYKETAGTIAVDSSATAEAKMAACCEEVACVQGCQGLIDRVYERCDGIEEWETYKVTMKATVELVAGCSPATRPVAVGAVAIVALLTGYLL